MDDPLLKWHEAFVAAGYEVEHFVTDPYINRFGSYGTLDKHRVAVWRGFNDQVHLVVDAAGLPPTLLVKTSQKSPSGGIPTMVWLRVSWLVGHWYYGWFLRDTVGFIQTLSSIRAVVRGNVQPFDRDNETQLGYMVDRWSIAKQQRYGDPPSEWLNEARTPEPPRRA